MAEAGGIAAGQLRQFIARIERLEDEKATLQADIREIYNEAKSVGFEPKIIRQVIRLRRMDRDQRQEQEALLELYLHAIEAGGLAEAGGLGEANEDDA